MEKLEQPLVTNGDGLKIMKVKVKRIQKETIIHYDKVRDFCKRSYPGHPHGCPNYGKKETCPPHAERFMNVIKSIPDGKYFLVYVNFDLEEQSRRMKEKNPHFTEKQSRNSRYWQSTVKKALREKIMSIYNANKNQAWYIIGCGSGFSTKKMSNIQKNVCSMEAMGINVFSTLKLNEIPFEVKPKKYVTLVCLLIAYRQLKEIEMD